jgi:hypothetical protein
VNVTVNDEHGTVISSATRLTRIEGELPRSDIKRAGMLFAEALEMRKNQESAEVALSRLREAVTLNRDAAARSGMYVQLGTLLQQLKRDREALHAFQIVLTNLGALNANVDRQRQKTRALIEQAKTALSDAEKSETPLETTLK